MSASEKLKEIGIPASVAAVIAAVITITPFLFKIDERYAKSSDLEEVVAKNDEKLSILTAEVGKLAGVTEVLVTVIGQQRDQLAYYRDDERPVRRMSAPVLAAAPPPPPPVLSAPPEEETPAEIDARYAAEAAMAEAAREDAAEEAMAEAVASAAIRESVAEDSNQIDDVLSRVQETLRSSQAVLNEIQE